MILGWLFTIAWMAGLTGLAVALWRVGLQGIFAALERVIVRLAHGPQRPRAVPAPLVPVRLEVGRQGACRHTVAPVPVEVHDAPDGAAEVVRWLCPDCTEEVPAPRPPQARKDGFGRYLEPAGGRTPDLDFAPLGQRWDAEYLRREAHALQARLSAITDSVEIDGHNASITEAQYREASRIVKRLEEIRRVIEAAAWDRLTPEERIRRNDLALRTEVLMTNGILSPTEASRIREDFERNNARPAMVLHGPMEVRELRCEDHDFLDVHTYASADAVDHICARCGHHAKGARRGR